jgi:hypothetical protein
MKNHILLFFGFVCASSYAADVMEYTVLADIPYWHNAFYIFTEPPHGYITLEVTPTLTYQDIQNAAQDQVGKATLVYKSDLSRSVDLNDIPITTTYNVLIGNSNDATKDRIKAFIENNFYFLLS